MKASSTIQNNNRHKDLCLLKVHGHPDQNEEDRTSSARASAVLKQQYLMLDLKTQFAGYGEHGRADFSRFLQRVWTSRFVDSREQRLPNFANLETGGGPKEWENGNGQQWAKWGWSHGREIKKSITIFIFLAKPLIRN
jgi:hypothetical protein